MARVFASTAIMAVITYAAKATASGHGLLTLVAVAGAGGAAYACSALLFDLAGIRSSVSALRWPPRVAAE
jgi:hypothetical protein